MATKQVVIPQIGQVTIYKRRGNRSLRLSIGADGEVRISMPTWLPYRAGEQFAASKALWIAAQRTGTQQVLLRHGQSIGKAHRLYFEQHALATKVQARLAPNQIRVRYPLLAEANESAVQRAAQQASIRALRKEAEMLLPQRLQTLAQQTGFTYRSVGVKQLKSRWGSCSSNKEVILNIFLMQLPWHLIDYVLVHELVHTQVMRHGTPFWREFERHVPHAKRLRQEIGNYQPVLSPGSTTVA
jgi:predicted metal-dependent hydrolase